MKILTEYPVRVVKKDKLYTRKNFQPTYAYASSDDFYGIDGKNKKQVEEFQKFANSKGANLVVDGLWTIKSGKKSNTQKAYDIYGSQWESSVVPIVAPTGNTQSSTPPTASAVPPTATNVEKMKKKGFNWDKAKGAWTKAQGFWGKLDETGLLGKAGDYFGLNLGSKTQTDGGAPIDSTEPIAEIPTEEKGMSKGMKIGLAVGGAVILIAVIYMATRSKGTTSKVATA